MAETEGERVVSVIVEVTVRRGFRDPVPGDKVRWRNGLGDAEVVAVIPEVMSHEV